MSNSTARIKSLDGLRTISILLVLISHSINAFGYNDPLVLGNLGVRIFFVVSGFLITGLLLREFTANNSINLTNFYFRRTLRIFPPFYTFLIWMFLLTVSGWLEIPLKGFIPAFTYTSNYLQTGNWTLAHTWSLSVEEQFYLLWPGVLLLFGKRRAFYILCLIVVLSPFIRILSYHLISPDEPIWLDDGFHANMDSLAFGCLLAFMRTRLHTYNYYLRLINSSFVIVFLIPIIIVANMQGQHPHLYDGLCITVMNLLIAFIIDWAVTNHRNMAGRLLNSSPLTTIGVMSYSIYLWQQPFLSRNSIRTPIQFSIRITGIIIMSVFSYLIVERASFEIRKKLQARWFPRN